MTEQKRPKKSTRQHFLDNIRIYLTILVIFHHAAIAYGGAGDWAMSEAATDGISPIIFTFFNALNQSYFMAAFFLMAGYFTPRSLEKKGTYKFLLERFIRLGIPILIYTTLIMNLNRYILSFQEGHEFQWFIGYQAGHLWFLQALLIFAVIFTIYRAIKKTDVSTTSHYQNTFPSDRLLWLAIAVLTICTFVFRIFVPVGEWIFNLQLGHFAHYIFAFFIGIMSYRGDWFNHLSKQQARRWGFLALVGIPIFFVIFLVGGATESEANVVKFLGGVHWQAGVYALWESYMLIAITTFMLYFFRERFNNVNKLAQFMAASVFTVYIIHQTVLYIIQVALLSLTLSTVLKFFIAGIVATIVCFLLSIPLRKLPYAKHVLG